MNKKLKIDGVHTDEVKKVKSNKQLFLILHCLLVVVLALALLVFFNPDKKDKDFVEPTSIPTVTYEPTPDVDIVTPTITITKTPNETVTPSTENWTDIVAGRATAKMEIKSLPEGFNQNIYVTYVDVNNSANEFTLTLCKSNNYTVTLSLPTGIYKCKDYSITSDEYKLLSNEIVLAEPREYVIPIEIK